MFTAVEAWDEAVLASLIAGATLLGADLKSGLLTNNPVVSKKNTLADVTEPTFGGYARQAVVMGAVYRDANGNIVADGAALTWQMTGPPVPTIVTGIFYTFGAGPALLGIEMFPAPIALNDDTDAFLSLMKYIESNAGQGFTTIIR